MKKLLITFGCSWTFGVGCGYQEGMSEEKYKEIAWEKSHADTYSFRTIISNNLGFDNINFAVGGSPNQKQLRLAKEFFFSNRFKKLQQEYDKIVVLWGITSTARNEVYSSNKKDYQHFLYRDQVSIEDIDEGKRSFEEFYESMNGQDWPAYTHFSRNGFRNMDSKIADEIKDYIRTVILEETYLKVPKVFFQQIYEHENSLYELMLELMLFNSLFESQNIDCLWFDTFNHHDYEPAFEKIDADTNIREKILFYTDKQRDLLSKMLKPVNKNIIYKLKYHASTWLNDNEYVDMGVKYKLLNPFSNHPTVLGHQRIAEILTPAIEKIIS